MNLYHKYNTIAKRNFGMSYDDILSVSSKQLSNLLIKYGIDKLIDVDYCLTSMPFDRVVHIINLFLSGEIFFKEFMNYYLDIEATTSLYEWELLALVHDICYIYETIYFSVDYLILDDVCNEMGLIPFFSKVSSQTFYSRKTYENYFKYKREQFGVCDHGIIAGVLFENRFPNKLKIEKLELAHIIAAHNIFVANRHNVSLYKKYGLYELIPDSPKFNCIANKKSKYAYVYIFFCLLDILEPVNAFGCVSPYEVIALLNSVNYEVIEKSIIIKVDHANQIETMAQRIFDIPIWLKVGLNIESDKRIIITVK